MTQNKVRISKDSGTTFSGFTTFKLYYIGT